ncbi:MAG TPA: hypothetical protein DCY55_11845 [Gammaproteobacteria bacterium]|nr:hypothetical protein [Gammaproteobacteria bacterium]
MDFVVLGIGVIILATAIRISYLSGIKRGESKVREDNALLHKDCISLRGLSEPARNKLKGHYQSTLVWDEKRGPNRHLYKKVHYD